MTTASDPQIVPRPPASLPALRAAPRTRASPPPWSRSSPTTPAASTASSGASSPAGATRWVFLLCRQNPSPWPATWPPGPTPAPASPPWGSPRPPLPKPTSGPSWNRPAGTRACARASLKGWGRRLSKPQRQSGALTADVLAVIRLTAVQSRRRGRGIETPAQAAERARFDLTLVAALSDAGPTPFPRLRL